MTPIITRRPTVTISYWISRNWRGYETHWVQELPFMTMAVTSAISVSGNRCPTCSTCLRGAGPERLIEVRGHRGVACGCPRRLRFSEYQESNPAFGGSGG